MNESQSGAGMDRARVIDQLLTPQVYEQLRAYASRMLRCDRLAGSVTASDVVHEAMLRIIRHYRIDLKNPQHLIAIAKRGMRQFLIEQARQRDAKKRGRGGSTLPLNDAAIADSVEHVEAEFQELIDLLSRQNARAALIARVHLFENRSITEAAEHLRISRTTASQNWPFARSWLFQNLRNSLPRPLAHNERQ